MLNLARAVSRRLVPFRTTTTARHVAVCASDDSLVMHVELSVKEPEPTSACCCVCDEKCAYRPSNRCHRRCDDCLRVVMPLYLQEVYRSRVQSPSEGGQGT